MQSTSCRMRRRSRWAALPLTLLLASCKTGPETRTVLDNCTPWAPIYVSRQDVLTDATAKAILRHDETGAKLCGWKPKTETKVK